MARLIADPRVPTAGVQMKAHNVMEGFLEVLGRWGAGGGWGGASGGEST